MVDAGGRALTPALFGGITGIGIEEVSGEPPTVDSTQSLGAGAQPEMTVRPEFDVTLAYNPESVLLPVARVEGIGFTLLSAGSTAGGSIVGGQGGVVRLDGSIDPIGPRVLFVHLGAGMSALSGNSRAAQWMLLDQLIDEARGRIAADSKHLAADAGRARRTGPLPRRPWSRRGRGTPRRRHPPAAALEQAPRRAHRHRRRQRGWKLASQLAAAKVPVFVDPLGNLPGDFDRIGATLENAARLQAAGAIVGIAQFGDGSHNARKIRQLAGNAVANGLPWADALAALTRVPAETFGVGGEVGSIAPGKRADLVLWSGDPLEISTVAEQMWLDGIAQSDALAPDRVARPLPARCGRLAARVSGRRALRRMLDPPACCGAERRDGSRDRCLWSVLVTGGFAIQPPGQFHAGEAVARDGERWLALRVDGHDAALMPVMLRVGMVEDALVDEPGQRTGRAVSSGVDDDRIVAFLRGDGLQVGVDRARDPDRVAPAQWRRPALRTHVPRAALPDRQ